MKKKWISLLALTLSFACVCGAAACDKEGETSSSSIPWTYDNSSYTQPNGNGGNSQSVNGQSSNQSSTGDDQTPDDSSENSVENSALHSSPEDSSEYSSEGSADDSSEEEVDSSSEDSLPEDSSPEDSSPEDSSDSSEGGEENEIPTNEDEIFNQVKAALQWASTYEGVYSGTATQYTRYSYPEFSQEVEALSQFAMNPAESKMLSVVYADSVLENVEKIYPNGGKTYSYLYDGYSGAGSLTELTQKELQAEIRSAREGSSPSYIATDCASFALADNWTELQTAFQTVTEISLAQIPDMTGSSIVAASYADGVSSVSIAIEGTFFDTDANMFSQREAYVDYFAQDGQLIGITMWVKMTYLSDGEVAGEQEGKLAVSYTYDFDEEFFNSILPEELGAEENTDVMITFECTENLSVGSSMSGASQEGKTAADIFAIVEKEALQDISYESGWYGEEDVPTMYTIEGWYVDEACTQKFDPNGVTVDQLRKIRTLYAKSFTMAAGYALIIEGDSVYENHLSKPFAIVERNGMFGASARRQLRIVNDGRVINYSDHDELYVNGELLSGTSLTAEGGNIYVIERVYYTEDSDYNLFSSYIGMNVPEA